MVENNERLVDLIAGGTLYPGKEKFDFTQLNAKKR